MSKILSLQKEDKIHIFKPPCRVMFFLLYRVYQKKVDKSETALYFVKRFNVRTFLLK